MAAAEGTEGGYGLMQPPSPAEGQNWGPAHHRRKKQIFPVLPDLAENRENKAL